MPSSQRNVLAQVRDTAHNARKGPTEDSLTTFTHEFKKSEREANKNGGARARSNPSSPVVPTLGFHSTPNGRSAPTTGRSLMLTARSRVNDPDYYNGWVNKARKSARGSGRSTPFGSFYNKSNPRTGPTSYNITQDAGRHASKISMGKRLNKHAQFIEDAEAKAKQTPAPGAYSPTKRRQDNAHSFGSSQRCLTPKSYAKRLSRNRSKPSFQMAAKSTFVPTRREGGVGITATALKTSPSFGFGGSRRF